MTRSEELESSVLKRVLLALRTCGGVEAYRNNVGRRGRVTFGLEVGSADIVAIVAPHGRWLCVETKRPKNAVVAERQEKWLRKMVAYGAVAGVCTTPEEAIALVELARRAAA